MAAFFKFRDNPRLFNLFFEKSQRRIKWLISPYVNARQNLFSMLINKYTSYPR